MAFITIARHYGEIRQGGWAIAWRKGRSLGLRVRRCVVLPLALAGCLVMRLVRPFILIRLSPLTSGRIGHFAVNGEIYLCRREAGIGVPRRRHLDLFFYNGPPANKQLALMWRRALRIYPGWLLEPVFALNRLFHDSAMHEVLHDQVDRDIHDLLPHSAPHLRFTPAEERRGEAGLRALGVPPDAEFVCLMVRDSAYLKSRAPHESFFDYHNYRDSNVDTYVRAAEALADRGLYVIRMGVVVNAPLRSRHPRVIDYATNGMRSDFMDIYLGARCLFCLSVATGFDSVPVTFRRPVAYVNMVPIGHFPTYLQGTVGITKKHWLVAERRWLSVGDVFRHDAGYCLSSSEYAARGVELVDNTPEEIAQVAIEMMDRLKGTWKADPVDEALQRRLWELYPLDARDPRIGPLHGTLRARWGAEFLRNNPDWLAC